MDNGKTLGFSDDEEVRYADVTSGGEGIIMLVRVTGGRYAIISPPLMIFKNKDRSYPIRNVSDNIPGVAYRTGPKRWMDPKIMESWLDEHRTVKALPNGRITKLYLDNCTGHNSNEGIFQATEAIRTVFNYLFPNSTELTQPCDSFIISKIKAAWRKRWDKFKMTLIEQNKWTEGGRLTTPCKSFKTSSGFC